MQYLLLTYGDEKQWGTLSTSEREAFEQACLANDEALRASGHLLAKEALSRNNTTTVLLHNRKVSVNEGPITATSESLNGIFFMEARDLNEVIQVAAQMPQVRCGPIEVRPMMALTFNNQKGSL